MLCLLALPFIGVLTKMPVFGIGFGCNNDKQNTLEEISFQRLPLKKPSFLNQKFLYGVCLLRLLVCSLVST